MIARRSTILTGFDSTPDGKVSWLMFAVGADTARPGRKASPAPRAAGTP